MISNGSAQPRAHTFMTPVTREERKQLSDSDSEDAPIQSLKIQPEDIKVAAAAQPKPARFNYDEKKEESEESDDNCAENP